MKTKEVVPRPVFALKAYGATVYRAQTYDECLVALLNMAPYSTEYALSVEGWSIERTPQPINYR